MIEENPVAFATVNDGGNPYCIAVAFVKVKDDKIVITDNYMKITKENIIKNPNVSLVVWNKNLEGYQINGKAEYFKEGKWKDFVKSIPENKDEPCKGAILVTINKIKKLA